MLSITCISVTDSVEGATSRPPQSAAVSGAPSRRMALPIERLPLSVNPLKVWSKGAFGGPKIPTVAAAWVKTKASGLRTSIGSSVIMVEVSVADCVADCVSRAMTGAVTEMVVELSPTCKVRLSSAARSARRVMFFSS